MSGRRDALLAVPGLAVLLHSQSGLARRDQLATLGVTPQHVAEQCAAGRWRVVSPTVEIRDELAVAGRIRHRAVVRDALDEAAAGAEALSEVDVDVLVRRAGLPAPRRQVRDASGRLDLEVDLPDGRLLKIEVDGPQHEMPEARWSDAQRDAQRSSAGHVSLRIPVFAVRHDSAGVVGQLVSIRTTAEQRARGRTT